MYKNASILILLVFIAGCAATQAPQKAPAPQVVSLTPEQKFAATLAAAQNGDGKEQYLLATMYEVGTGTVRDDVAAVDWYRKSASQGYMPAAYVMAVRYRAGWGIAQSYPDAAVWLRRVAENGDKIAAYRLADMYDLGLGVQKDDVAAAKWMKLAAENIYNPDAMSRMAQMYRTGRGVPVNNEEADRLLKGVKATPEVVNKPSSGSKPAIVTSRVCMPEYPRASVSANEEGTVRLSFVIDANGLLDSLSIPQSSGYHRLDMATVAALSICKFRPAVLDGVAVQSSFTVDYVWKLEP